MKEYMRLYGQAKRGAKARGIDFLLSEDEFKKIVLDSHNTCAISGILFDFSQNDSGVRRPWMPSIDRIDSSLPYTEKNCRLVCVAVNIAMNEWGEAVLYKIARGITRDEYTHVAEAVSENVYEKVSSLLKAEASRLANALSYDISNAVDKKIESMSKHVNEKSKIVSNPQPANAPTSTSTGSKESHLVCAKEARMMLGGISNMTLWRWVRDGVLVEPRRIRDRKYWLRQDIINLASNAFEEAQA